MEKALPDSFTDLIDATQRKELVAFIGSGLSRSAGVSSWKDLLRELVSVARGKPRPDHGKLRAATEAIDGNRLINAATLIETTFGKKEDFQREIVRIISRVKPLRPTKSHDILLRLLLGRNLRAIVTTNYDKLFESAMARVASYSIDSKYFGSAMEEIAFYSISNKNIAQAIKYGKPFILHFHGDVDNPEDIIISWADYNKLSVSNPNFELMKSFLMLYKVLWIGYSHSDPDINIFTALSDYLNIQSSFHLMLEDDWELESICEARGITPMPVLESHCDIPEFLKKLELLTEPPIVEAVLKYGYDSKCVNERTGIPEDHFLEILDSWRRDITDYFCLYMPGLPDNLMPIKCSYNDSPDDVINERNANEFFSSWTEKGCLGKKIAIVAPPSVGKTVLLTEFAEWLQDQGTQGHGNVEKIDPLVIFLTPANIPVFSLPFSKTDENIEKDAEIFWDYIQQRAGNIVERPHQLKQEFLDVLKPFRENGRIFLLFDGLDEFGSRRRGDLHKLMQIFRYLAEEKQVNVFFTCREVFWNQPMIKEDRAGWDIVKVLPFDEDRINELRSQNDRIYRQLKRMKFAYDDQRLKPGRLNQLIIFFVNDLQEGLEEDTEFELRSALYESWMNHKVRRAADRTKIPEAHWQKLFRGAAMQLLQEERLSIVPSKLSLDCERFLTYQCLETGIFIPSGDERGIRFRHESVNEFLVALVLASSFRKAVETPLDYETLDDLPLADVDLDFLQPSVYGFLHEKLEHSEQQGEEFLCKLIEALNKVSSDLLSEDDAERDSGKPRLLKLLRNLVEYIGFTYTDETEYQHKIKNRDVALCLLSLIKNQELDSERASDPDHDLVRYNAARALERIHPMAPRPYFDYMSDWGDHDWQEEREQTFGKGILFSMELALQKDLENGNFSEQLRQQFTNNNPLLPQNVTIQVKEGQNTWIIHDEGGIILYVIKKEDDILNTYREKLRPWAIRGYRSSDPLRRRRPGYHPALAVCKSEKTDDVLQSKVSRELIEILQGLVEDLKRNEWLIINCSHALARWYHDEQRAELDDLRGKLLEKPVVKDMLRLEENYVYVPRETQEIVAKIENLRESYKQTGEYAIDRDIEIFAILDNLLKWVGNQRFSGRDNIIDNNDGQE